MLALELLLQGGAAALPLHFPAPQPPARLVSRCRSLARGGGGGCCWGAALGWRWG